MFAMARVRTKTMYRSRYPRTGTSLCVIATLVLAGCAGSPFTHESGDTAKGAAAQRTADEKKPPFVRGDDAVTRGDFAAATGFYKSAHEANPKSLEPLRRLGAAELALGQYTEAYETYHALQVIAPDDAEAAFRMGELVLMRGSPQAAIDQLTIALAARKNDPALYSVVGVAYSMMGKYELAIRNYEAGLKLVPDHQGLLNNLGLAQFLAGDSKGAIKTFTDLVALPDAKPRYRQNLAFIYVVNGDMEKASEVAGKGVDLATLDSDLKNFRALQEPDAVVMGDNRTMMGVHMSSDAAVHSLAATVAASRKREIAAIAAKAAVQQAAIDTAKTTTDLQPIAAATPADTPQIRTVLKDLAVATSETPRAVLAQGGSTITAAVPISDIQARWQPQLVSDSTTSNDAATPTQPACLPAIKASVHNMLPTANRPVELSRAKAKPDAEMHPGKSVPIYIPASSRGPGFFFYPPQMKTALGEQPD